MSWFIKVAYHFLKNSLQVDKNIEVQENNTQYKTKAISTINNKKIPLFIP